eukprot:sb/3476160/
MSTIKIKLKHQVTWQMRKCTCMILALPATFNQLYHSYLVLYLFKNSGDFLKFQNHARAFPYLPCDLVLQFDFHGAHWKDKFNPNKMAHSRRPGIVPACSRSLFLQNSNRFGGTARPPLS